MHEMAKGTQTTSRTRRFKPRKGVSEDNDRHALREISVFTAVRKGMCLLLASRSALVEE